MARGQLISYEVLTKSEKETAKKLALLLAENKTSLIKIDKIISEAKSLLIVDFI